MSRVGFESVVRKMVPITSALLVLVVLYIGWVFYARRRDAREADERAKAKEAENARYTIDKYGGGRVKILRIKGSKLESGCHS